MHISSPDTPHRGRRFILIVLAIVGASLAAIGGPASAGTDVPSGLGDDIIQLGPNVPDADAPTLELAVSPPSDPHGLLPYLGETSKYTLGVDTFEVWECSDLGPVPMSASAFVAEAESKMTTYFSWLSGGRYDPDFIVGGRVPDGVSDCAAWVSDPDFERWTGKANAALFIRNDTGGRAGPGWTCARNSSGCASTYPENQREGYIGVSSSWKWTILAHEMGHMLSWPHSSTGLSASQYDNAIDVMSGNYNKWTEDSRTYMGTYREPYATIAINRYAAGWIDSDDVVVWDGGEHVIDLKTIGTSGVQAVVVDDGASYYVIGSRISSEEDPFAPAWSGVEVYQVEHCDSDGCWGIGRDVTTFNGTPFDVNESTSDSYSNPLAHVIQPGDSVTIGDAKVTVVEPSTTGFRVAIAVDSAGSGTRFSDVPVSHTFFEDIEWLAAEAITKGCNPPSNTRYCPDDVVTRGQMAAFLVRAFDLPVTNEDYFGDDNESAFQSDINRLASAGITKGCNPPANDRFCPESKLTRAQMAAFLTRTLGYTDDGGGNLFIDDNSSIFEHDIDLLGFAGITKGCNPPVNDMFCPDAFITRDQMAAFLHRATG